MFKHLEEKIKAAYESGVTMEEAERLAGEFLSAQITVAEHLRNKDLDARMRKTGLKALKAAVYLDEVKKNEKKPTEAALTAVIDSSDLVVGEQGAFDEAEVDRDQFQNYLNIFNQAHHYFRAISKGSFGG